MQVETVFFLVDLPERLDEICQRSWLLRVELSMNDDRGIGPFIAHVKNMLTGDTLWGKTLKNIIKMNFVFK